MYSNIVKQYANWSVCFLCGFDMENGHTSKMCPWQLQCANHQEWYDRANANQYIAAGYNACTKAMHKSQLPCWWCGAVQVVVKCVKSFDAKPILYPTQNIVVNDDDKRVITLNITKRHKMCGIVTPPKKPSIPPTHAVTITGPTLVFVLKGTPMKNIQPTTNPLTINLPDGTVVQSTHRCNF